MARGQMMRNKNWCSPACPIGSWHPDTMIPGKNTEIGNGARQYAGPQYSHVFSFPCGHPS
jgi:hypothetical protein